MQLLNLNENEQKTFKIKEIVDEKSLVAYFQPIVSVGRKMICGFEGLVRGINTLTNELISPIDLFKAAQDEGLVIELDRACRDIVIKSFANLYSENSNMLLFLNIDASIIDFVGGSNYLIDQVYRYGMRPENIVIEIKETIVQDPTALKKFINRYRKLGFLIALDDVGSGFSNLDRIPLAKPDIIKIDLSLVRNIHNNYYKQEVFKSLVSLANRIGALIIAEGVEIEQEAVETLKIGGHMIQGYYFSKPQEVCSIQDIINKLDILSTSFKTFINKKIKEERQKYKHLNLVVNTAIEELSQLKSDDFNEKLSLTAYSNKIIECIYVLDEKGIQISDTICFCCKDGGKENLIFYSARKGTDHSMKGYYYNLTNAKLRKHITDPYVSLATGNLCITYSKLFTNIDNKEYILCIDFFDFLREIKFY